MKRLALALVLVAATAAADPVRTDPSPNITVFADADGAHVVTLVAKGKKPTLDTVMNQKENGEAHGGLGLGKGGVYFVRIRFVDGRLVCEKFGLRPKADEEMAARAAELFKMSCS